MNIKHIFTGIATVALIAPSLQAANWGTNLPAALQQAGQSGKKVLVIFTGSDWCGPCIALKNNVLNTADFDAYAEKNFVLVELDFPRSKPMSAAQKAANKQYAERYGVRGYPTLLVLSPDGKELARIVGGVNGVAGLKEELSDVVVEAPAGVVCVDGVCTIPDADDQSEEEAAEALEKEKEAFIEENMARYEELTEELARLNEDPEALYDFTTEELERDDLNSLEEYTLHFYQSLAIVQTATSVEELEDLVEVLEDEVIPAFEDEFPELTEDFNGLLELLKKPGNLEQLVEENTM